MRFSTRVRYGLRGLAELAEKHEKGPVLLKDISRRQKISMKYLDHIFSLLKAKGLIKKEKAKRGGYLLARAPSEISLYDIVVALEGIDIMECLKSGPGCPLMQSCGVRIVWKQFEERFENLLRDFNLQDILREKENLAKTQGVYTYQI